MTDETSTSKSPDATDAFVSWLRGLAEAENRGALAALRSSLRERDGVAMAACPYVMPFLGGEANLPRERAFFLIGALFALHPESGAPDRSLGHAFREINDRQEGVGRADDDSIRARFVALLDADTEDLRIQLRHAVTLAKARQVTFDWNRLLRDVLGWRDPGRRVQRRLAREFWRSNRESFQKEGEALP